MNKQVQMVDLHAQYLRIKSEIDTAMMRVVETTAFIKGPDCTAFEKEFAEFCGVAACVGVANGTDALIYALRAYGVGPGDEVVTVANTFIATGEAIMLNGATPVFVDVDDVTYTLDPAKLAAAITSKTKVIIPVHLYGHPCAMEAINKIACEHGIPVLEDSAQGHAATLNGKRAGSLGHAACFSFYPGKNLGAYGDAGAVVSNDKEFIAKVRQIANHGGGTNKYDNVIVGTNSRLDTLQAAILRAKLPHLQQWTEERAERAALYSKLLAGIPGLITPKEAPGATSAWHLYTIRTAKRDGLIEELKKQGISTAVHYPRPIHLQPAMAPAGGKVGDLPVSEGLTKEVVCLPLYPELPLSEVERIAAAVRSFLTA
ncbi:MAG: DegT/DnrJ/EryC1/StrS family aminotransferase [Vicinamibacteria bacterium]